MRLNRTVLLSMSLVVVGPAPNQTSNEAGVRAAINQYFRGHATAQRDTMAAAFLPSAHIEGIRDGVFTSWTVSEYAGRFTGRPAADEASPQTNDRPGGHLRYSRHCQCNTRPRRDDVHRLLCAAQRERHVEDREQGVFVAANEIGSRVGGRGSRTSPKARRRLRGATLDSELGRGEHTESHAIVKKTVLLYGMLGGVLIAALKLIEYRFLVLEHSLEIYGGIVALIFAGVGIWLGLKLTRKEVIEVPVPVVGTVHERTRPRSRSSASLRGKWRSWRPWPRDSATARSASGCS